MTIIVNFDLEKRDSEVFLMCFFSVFRLFAQYRDNLKKTYLLSQVILWLETDFLPNNPHAGISSVRYFSRLKIKRFKINP
jgi:hypothetical protein